MKRTDTLVPYAVVVRALVAGAWLARGRRAGNDNPQRHRGETHGRIRLVDVLAAGARGAVGVDAQVLVEHLDLDGVVTHRIGSHRGHAGMPARVGIGGRDAHQPVPAAIVLQPTLGIRAVALSGGRLSTIPLSVLPFLEDRRSVE